MKNSALIFLISVFSAAAFAVTPKIDSLKKACQDAGLSDFDKTIEICDLGIRASEASRDSDSLAWFNRNIGVAYYFKGEYEAASKFYFKSITILERANQPSELAAAYNDLAKLYRKTRKLKQAEENYDKAMSISLRSKTVTILPLFTMNQELCLNMPESMKKRSSVGSTPFSLL